MKKLRTIICFIVLALTVPAVTQLRGRLPMDTQPLIERKYGGWSGVLRLWIHEGWPTGTGSAAAWVNRCITSFEKRHPGVYIQPEYVDASTLRSLGSDGLLPPDMVMFPPGGLTSASALVPLNDGYAQPVLMGGYMWAFNAALLDSIPRSWRDAEVSPVCPPDEDHRMWTAALLALCSGKYSADAPQVTDDIGDELELGLDAEIIEPTPSPIPEDGPLRCLLPEGFVPSADAWRDFINGEAAAMPVTQREVRRLQALGDQGRGIDWQLSPGSGAFTDQVLYIGVVDQTEAEKVSLCRAFADHLLSDECQGELHRVGAFSAIGSDPGYAAGDPLAAMDAMLRREPPVMPGPFDTGWRDAAEGIVRKFLDGDPDPAALWAELSERIRQKSEH